MGQFCITFQEDQYCLCSLQREQSLLIPKGAAQMVPSEARFGHVRCSTGAEALVSNPGGIGCLEQSWQL